MTDALSKHSGIDELALLRKVLEASPSFLHVLQGPDFIFEYANEAYYCLVGRRDLIGRPAFEAIPEASSEYAERIAQVMATKQPFHGQEISVMLAREPGAPQGGPLAPHRQVGVVVEEQLQRLHGRGVSPRRG